MKRNFFRRLRAGFTLAESLIAVAVLAILSAGLITVATTVLGTKRTITEAGNSHSLATTAVMTIADEIRFGQNVRLVGEKIVLDSATFGADTTFSVGDGQIVALSGSRSYPLLPAGYYGSLTVGSLTLEKVSGGGTEKDAVKISVSVNGGGVQSYTTELTVTPLNGFKQI